MKKILIILFVLITILLPEQLLSQTLNPLYETCFGGTGWDEATGIIKNDSTYIVVGYTESNNGDISFNHGKADILFVHMDKKGNILSEKTFGGSKWEDGYTMIKKLNDSVFYIMGNTKSTDGDVHTNLWPNAIGNLWVLQITDKGEILWERVCGGNGQTTCRDMQVTDDGGVVALGVTSASDGDITDYFGRYDLWLIKLNRNGEKVWDKTLGGGGLDGGASLIRTSDNGFLVVGYTDGFPGGNYDTACNFHNPGTGYSDLWVVKLDSVANIEWQQCYGGKYDEIGDNAIETEDGYIILGGTMSDDGDVSGLHGPPGPNSKYGEDIWVIKIDKTGNLLWQRCLGGYYDEFSRNIFTTTDGGYMIVGTTASNDGNAMGCNEGYPGHGMYDVWFVKIDSAGNYVWHQCYGGNADEYLYRGVVQKSDWDYVVALTTLSPEWRCSLANPDAYDIRITELKDCSNEPPVRAPDTIYGPGEICSATDTTVYYTTVKVPKATSYEWVVSPLGAGTVTSHSGTGCNIRWYRSYTGSAAVYVRGFNGCNRFKWSPMKEVKVHYCTGIEEYTGNAATLSVYPNPATNNVTFELSVPPPPGTTLTLYNIIGKPVATLPVKTLKTHWNTEFCKPGVYFYKLEGRNVLKRGRVVKK